MISDRILHRIFAVFLAILSLFASASAFAADLQVSQYSWTPDPVPNGAETTFALRATNNGPGSVNNAVVTIAISNRFEVTNAAGNYPAYCMLGGAVGTQTLTCSLPTLASGIGNSQNFTYRANAIATGATDTVASIAAAGNSDNNATNNSLTVTPTVRSGVDLSLTKTGSAASLPAGSTLTYTLTARNDGPNTSAAVRVTDNLPAASDFQYQSASGTNWSCSLSGTTVTCNYTGAALAVPAVYPAISIIGRVVKATAGTITNIASIQSTDPFILDRNGSNNSSAPVVTTITAGSEIQPTKTMPATIIVGANANITLGIRNNGPQPVPAGTQIADIIASSLTIGTLPSGCTSSSNTVTCTAGPVAVNATTTFVIPVTGATPTGSVVTNQATMTPPSGFTDANLTNNTASAPFNVLPANADLEITSKVKTPDPVLPGQPVTSTMTLRNNGPSIATYDPTNPIIIQDTLGANENIISSGAGWNCTPSGLVITCRTTGTGTVAVNGTLSLALVTEAAAGTDAGIPNTACTDLTAGSTHLPSHASSPTANDCITANVRATTQSADLGIEKDVSLVNNGGWAENIAIADSASTFYIRLRVTNIAGDTARTVNVADVLPNFLNIDGFTTVATPDSVTSGSMSYTASTGRVSWTLANLAVGSTATLIIKVDRPFESGSYTNTATVASPDTTDSVPGNNSNTATYSVAAIADMTVNAKSITPNPAQVGVLATYLISVRNNGANAAQGVVVTDTIDPARFEIIGTPTTTKTGASCTVTTATGLVSCTMNTFARVEVRQISVVVRPLYPFGGTVLGGFPVAHTNRAKVTTTTFDSNGGSDPDAGNNFFNLTHNVNAPGFDLAVSKSESNPATDDPIRTDETLKYDVRISNFGPSRATDILLTDIPAPPAGATMTLDSVTINPVAANLGLTLQPAPAASCVASGANYICKVDPGNPAANFLDPLKQVVFRMVFTQTGGVAGGPATFTNSAELTAAEHPVWNGTGSADTQTANNRAVQTTTVLPSTDLEVVSKTRTGALVRNINESVEFTIRIRNNGPSATSQVRVSDTLPSGFVFVSSVTPTATIPGGSTASVSGISCTGTTTITCVLNGSFPAGAAELVDIKLSVRAAHPYTAALDPADRTDTATITPGQDVGGNPLSEDGDATNNSKTEVVRIQQASLAGTVYADDDRSGTFAANEELVGVTLTLTGTDVYGNAITRVTTTNGTGNYLFDRLPPANATGYTITETHPGGFFDATEVSGSAGGSVNAAFGNADAQNRITGIGLNAGIAGTGYDFREFSAARVSGYIYRDQNNDGTRSGAGETGFSPGDFATTPQLRLTGTDYAGNAVDLTATVDGSGTYSFAGLAPSDTVNGYSVTQLVQPTGASDGLDTNGTGSVLAASNGRSAPETLPVGTVAAGADLTERNFGELPTAALSGRVYFDPNANAIRDGTENTGLASASIRLTGTNDLNQAIDCTIATDATGTYSFPINSDPEPKCRSLRPGTYAITETPPSGLVHTGAFIGTLGGTSGAVSGVSSAAPGAANLAVTNIIVTAGSSGSNYDFGENGQGLSGSVYIDANRNSQREAAEAGIAGVVITLSGTTSSGQNVCDFISCTATTNAAGTYNFLNLPGANAAGYTLTEQAQTAPPLSNFADGAETVGGNGTVTRGSAGADVFTGIVNNAGEMLTGYNFGEHGARLAGAVYVDRNNNAAKDAGENGVSGVLVTLSGTITSSGQDICAYLAALAPAGSCTATTNATGGYDFGALPAGSYVLLESQPTAYADGKESSSTAGTAVSSASFTSAPADNRIANIVLAPGADSPNNLFGELGVTVSGRVYKDPQRDGADAGGEPGIAGVTIRLMQGNTVVATTTTAADGSFSFADLSAGTYAIVEVQPAGYGSSTNDSIPLTLVAGSNQSVAFGDTVSSLSGNVFVDGTNDGVRQSPAEAGIPDAVITLTGTDAAGAAVNRSATTKADGTYRFDDLLAGTYVVSEAQPGSYGDGKDSAGSSGGTVANDNISAVALATAVDATAYDFGERGQSLTGVVYDDRNREGRFNGPDTPIAGVRVELQRPNGTVVAFAITDATGRYTISDIEAGDYVLVEVQPVGYGDGAENTANRLPFTVTANAAIAPINFGELSGSLSGLVYNDTNRNGLRGTTEPAIPGVTVTLSGTTARNEEICAYLASLTPQGSCTVTTDAAGSWRFTGLPGGTYAVTETQPAGFNDGAESLGTAGGTVGADQFSAIVLAPAGDATGYLFGEQGNVGQISGTVWLDANHDRKRDIGEVVFTGWNVQLWLGNTQIASTTTGNAGAYEFADVAPGVGYRLRFISPEGIIASGARTNESASNANPGNATIVNGEITNITVQPGNNVPQQSLPLDPSGIVYDSVRRVPVEGAKVTITGPAGFDPSIHLVGGTANVAQTTGTSGFYQYLLMPGAPSGTYGLSVAPPSGSYNPIQPSTIIPPCPGPQVVGSSPNPYLVSLISSAPANGTAGGCTLHTASTAYFMAFTLTAGVSADVLNNNIPIDPILKGALVVTKVTPKVNVSRGELVPYTITARNTLNGQLTGIAITDRLPAGFQYRTGSARIDGIAAEPVQVGRTLSWNNQSFAAKAEKKLDLLLVVGAGVAEGEHVNQAYAVNTIVDTVVSDVAEAAVRIVPDPDFDCTDIIGKVFDDRNVNGMQDAGEPGLPGVRLATVNGLLITTDQHGRYHVTCPMIPNEARGSNFILKLDVRTLPTGYRVTTGNPETVRLTPGKFATLNFGASITRVVRADITDAVFEGDKVSDVYRSHIERLISALAEKPSVLRIAYARTSEDAGLIRRRMDAVKDLVRKCWKEDGDRYRLIIEEEITATDANNTGDMK